MTVQYRADAGDQVFADDVVEAVWPYDGPHDPHLVEQAAAAMAALTRYLNNATSYGVRSGPALGRIVSNLATTVFRCNQLLEQLERAAVAVSGDRTLYDDRRDRDGIDTALELDVELRAARVTLALVANRLEQAAGMAGHLGHDR